MIRAALADLGKTRVSASEAEAMHADKNELVHGMNKVEPKVGGGLFSPAGKWLRLELQLD